ncbi:unnamed protein product, partial [Symbiodinium sp. KB8]
MMPPHSQVMMDTQMDVDDTGMGGSSAGHPVHYCLLRKDTCDLQVPAAAAAVPTQPKQMQEHCRESEVLNTEEEQRKQAEAAAKKKDFLQANMDWLQSTIVVNSRTFTTNVRHGEYTLMSRGDLLAKYHDDVETVDAIIADKEEQLLFESNPDRPAMRLYWCWDATREVRTDGSATEMDIRREGLARPIWGRHFDHQHFQEGGDGNANPKGKGKGKGTNKGNSTDAPENPGNTTEQAEEVKAKSAVQEAKKAMKTASDLILECRSWGSLLATSETPEALREAVLKDVHQYLDALEDSRKAVEASVSIGAEDAVVRLKVSELAVVIADYKKAARSSSAFAEHLISSLGRGVDALDFYYITIPVRDLKSENRKATTTARERHRVNVGPDVLQRFWMHWKQHRYPHPAADAASSGGKLYTPIGVSGDDAQYTLGGAKIIVMLLSFCLHEAQALELSRFPWFVLRGEYNLGPPTLDGPLRVLAWSLNVAYGGVFPAVGPCGDALSEARRKQANKPLAGGPYALVEIRGDWKWHYEIFRFSKFEAFRDTPRLSPSQFITKALGSYVAPLTWVTGFNPEAIHYCAMHVVNLGLAQWINAATLLALLDRGFFGAKTVALAARLQVCTLRFRRWCSLHGIMQSQPFITVGMLHMGSAAAPTAPELTLKAYHGRVFLAFLSCCCEVALQSAGDDSELQLIAALTSNLAHWHLAVESYPRYLLPDQATRLWSLANRTCLLYRSLAARAIRAGSLCWPLKPKLHAFLEINFFMCKNLYNCRYTHCFKDEDCMGLCKHI